MTVGDVEDWHGKATRSSIEASARAMCAPPAPKPRAPDLHSRIEAIIYRELDYYGHNLSGHLAEVLVRELDELQ